MFKSPLGHKITPFATEPQVMAPPPSLDPQSALLCLVIKNSIASDRSGKATTEHAHAAVHG